jgi:hypothetical protein
MIKIPLRIEFIARLSLSFLWLFTAATSFWWARNIGYEVLATQNIHGDFANFCINVGSMLDAILGVWLLTQYQLRYCYLLQLILVTTYTLLLGLIAPEFWLHPFGPLTKNLPLIILLYLLYKSTDQTVLK